MTILQRSKTQGSTSFATCGDGSHQLFHINPGVPAVAALEYAAMLQECVNQALLEVVEGDARPASLWPALYMGEMARAIIDDLTVPSSPVPGVD